MFKSPLMLAALTITTAIAAWGIIDTNGLASFASRTVGTLFRSRGWFIMLTVSVFLIVCVWLYVSPYGRIKLGKDDDEPEFSTISWLTMLFAAGMGVGLLYWGAAEPMTHFLVIRSEFDEREAATAARFLTNFHWGLHAWAIYAVTALVIAYFGFRRGCASLISAPIRDIFGSARWVRGLGAFSDLMAIVAIAIGLGGSIAMGVFQIQGGVATLTGTDSGTGLALGVFVAVCLAYALPLVVDLGRGMALLSNTAMAIAVGLLVFVVLAGPTHYLMDGVVESLGEYVTGAIPHGFRTFTFFDDTARDWFGSWTLTYMVWWLAWGPFVGVFIARISKGRTIREFVLGVVVVPSLFSVFWFGTMGGLAFYAELRADLPVAEVVASDISDTTFFILRALPLSTLTSAATILAAFLFIVTSVVSAAFVLGMFSTGGDLNPSARVKLAWGVILGALGLVMVLSDSMDAVKPIIALGAMPFVFITLLLMVCLLKALKTEKL